MEDIAASDRPSVLAMVATVPKVATFCAQCVCVVICGDGEVHPYDGQTR